MKKVCLSIALISMLIFTVLLFSGCVEGFVSDDEYKTLISGVTAYDDKGNNYFYGNEILQNNVEFDTQIEYKNYCKLEIRKVKDCKIRGAVFVVRSLETTTLKFTFFANDVQLISKQKMIEKDRTVDIDLFFEPYPISLSDNLYIEIEQISEKNNKEENDENIKYKFDGFMVAFGE